MTNEDVTKQLAEMRKEMDEVRKAAGYSQPSTATTGLQIYDLEAPSKSLFPVDTPLRNMIPRVSGKGGIQANWRAITGINVNRLNAGVGEGQRNAQLEHTVKEYFAAYRTIGHDDSVTFEADLVANGFEDIKATATRNLLYSLMISEEQIILGGNTSLALGTCSTPTLVANTTGGALSNGLTVNVYCVALTLDGYQQLVGRNMGATGEQLDLTTAVLNSTVTRVNMDGTVTTVNGGTSIKSAVATVTTAGSGAASVSASVTPVRGAVAYAWYWDITGTASAAKLGAVSTINSVLITAAATGTQTISGLFTTDCSQNGLVFDGILSQIMASGSNAYFYDLPTGTAGTGTALTSDGSGFCSQINDALASFYDLYRLSPDKMFMSARQHLALSKIIIANGGAPLLRIARDANYSGDIFAGNRVTSYVNPVNGKVLDIVVHPNMPNGIVLFWSNSIPYPGANISAPIVMRCLRDYYSMAWPVTTRRYEYGVYANEVLQCYFPPAYGILRNIAV